jgi:hypothetical protein
MRSRRACECSPRRRVPQVLAQHAPGWAENLPSSRHYLYPIHRSTAFVTPPSLAAAIYLLVLRWLAHDYEAVMSPE